MIKSNKEVTLKTRETFFLHNRKPQKLKIAKNIFRKLFSKKNESFFYSVSRIVPKKRKLASYRRINKIGVSFKNGQR